MLTLFREVRGGLFGSLKELSSLSLLSLLDLWDKAPKIWNYGGFGFGFIWRLWLECLDLEGMVTSEDRFFLGGVKSWIGRVKLFITYRQELW